MNIFFSMQAENHRRQRGYTTVGDLEGCVHYKVGKSGAKLQLNPKAGQLRSSKGVTFCVRRENTNIVEQ